MLTFLKNILNKKEVNNSEYSIKYRNSGLTETFAEELNENLIRLMSVDKIFLDSELNLEELSKNLNTSIHLASQLINQYYNKNFRDYINDFRIDEAKDLIMKHKNPHIDKIAFDVGFKSKSSFYSAFKKRTNVSPSKFKSMYGEIRVPEL